jgi:hypothetical protein
MQLNQTTLRGILAEILSVDEKYIVPKQGNWWNPQEKNYDVATWCGYRIKSNKARTPPMYRELKDGVNSVVVLKLAIIELQFVGKLSEELAQSVAFWNLRNDVKEAFEKCGGAVVYSDQNAISSNFYQDGNNDVIAWNIPELKILWYDILETNQQPLTNIEVGGNVNVRL